MFFKKKPSRPVPAKKRNLFENYQLVSKEEVEQSTPIFITGVGRSGTHFLARLFDAIDRIKGFHLDEVGNSTADSFLMYAKWHRLNIDYSAFFNSRNFLINQVDKESKIYLESNPYLALSANDILNYYPNAKVVHVIRDPRKVVLSHLNKGWYNDFSPQLLEFDKVPFYHYEIHQPNHFFGRIFPTSQDEFEHWKGLSQVGKISWMWATINAQMLNGIDQENQLRYRQLRIDQFDHGQFSMLMDWFGIDAMMDEEIFERISNEGHGKTKAKTTDSWSEQEELEFVSETSRF